jgi:hypothetical protein
LVAWRADVNAVSIWEPAAEQYAKALGPDALILQGPDYRIAALIDASVWREAQGAPAAKSASPHR